MLLAMTATVTVILAGCGVIMPLLQHEVQDEVQDEVQERISGVSEDAIVVQGSAALRSHIYVIEQDGTYEVRSIHAAENVAGAVLSPDGKNIAFLRTDDIGVTHVFVMNPDGTNKTQITANNPFRDVAYTVRGQPAWSPDSERVAFTSYTAEALEPATSADPVSAPAEEVNGIYVANASGVGVPIMIRKVPEDSEDWLRGEGRDRNLTWSPDGGKIAFYGGALYVFKGQLSPIFKLPSVHPPYTWSPDGKRIAYEDDNERDIYVVNADGSGERRLANTIPYSLPAWSPDGKKLAFFCPARPGSGESSGLCMINADGTEWLRLDFDVD